METKPTKMKTTNLEVKKVRYFKTNRGVGYQCKTNYDGVEILNDGNGGSTYLEGKYSELKSLKLHTKTEWELEKIINKFENKQKQLKAKQRLSLIHI